MYLIKQVIVVRIRYPDGKGGTVGLRTGKIAAQVAHASLKVFFDRKLKLLGDRDPSEYLELADGRPEFPETTWDLLMIPLTPEMAEWVNGSFAKIVLGVDSEADLLKVHEAAKAAGLPTALITDLGFTEFKKTCPDCPDRKPPCPTCGGTGKVPNPTRTCVAIGPADSAEIDKITGRLKLI